MILNMLLLGLGLGQGTPDPSASLDELLKKGLPAPDRLWTAQDMERAVGVLRKIAEENPDRLPRAASPSSGVVFRRLVARENLEMYLSDKTPLQVRLPQKGQWVGHAGELTRLYVKAMMSGKDVDAEVVGIFTLQVGVMPSLLEDAAQFMQTLDPKDPKREARQAGYEQMRKGLSTALTGYLDFLGDRENVAVVHRLEMIRALAPELRRIARFLGPHTQAELPARLNRLAEGETDPKVLEGLSTLRKALPENPKPEDP